MNLQKYGRSQYDWPTLSFKFIAYKLLPEWRLIEFWRVFRCKKSTLFRARQVTYEMHNNTPLSHPKLATFGFYAKSTEAIFLYIEAIFYAVGNFLYFYVWSVSVANMRIGRALLYCVSFRILLNLRHLLSWLYGVTSCGLSPHELHWLHWAMTVRSKVLTKSINEIVKIPRNRLADGQYDTERYCH